MDFLAPGLALGVVGVQPSRNHEYNDEAHGHQECSGDLLHRHALALHFRRQTRQRDVDSVLRLHSGDIGIGAELKGDGDELSDQREVRVQASGFKSCLFVDDDEEDLMVENEVDCYLDRIRTPQANSMVAPFFSMVERS